MSRLRYDKYFALVLFEYLSPFIILDVVPHWQAYIAHVKRKGTVVARIR